MKTFPVLSVLFFFTVQEAFCQLSDDFSDGDLAFNPSWNGVVNDFRVNESQQLQLNAVSAGISWISTPFPPLELNGTEWVFLIKQSFSPSAANFSRLYLMSDQADLSGALNGYFLQFGEAGSNDAVELIRQSGTTLSSICRASAARIAAAFEIRIKVLRHPPGLWHIYIDYNAGSQFALEASGTDDTHASYQYFGLLCTYTISNATRFYFDDIAIKGMGSPDVSPPQLTSIEVTSSQSLRLAFSEPLDTTAEETEHYLVSPHGGYPESANLLDDLRVIELTFKDLFANGEESVLIVENIRDHSGNLMPRTQKEFLYFYQYPVSFRDVVISEIFADPAPPIGLPEAEFVEIYNRSAAAVSLSGWSLADEATSAELPYFILRPREHLILTSSGSVDLFKSFGNVLGVPRFPALNNGEDVLVLKNENGEIIDSLKYTSLWYRDDEKVDGGWSLELIDPEDTCAEGENWAASDDLAGGTPGKQNSIFANRPDNRGPILVSIIPQDSISIFLSFNEKLANVVPSATDFIFDPPIAIASVHFSDLSLRRIEIALSQALEPSRSYSVTLRDIYDCAGNRMDDDFSHASFLLPQDAEPSDIIVNEILFNPRPTGVDFIEVYNRSNKVIDIKGWVLRNSGNRSGKNSSEISTDHALIHPGEYKVFTEDPDVLKGEYVMAREETFVRSEIPPLNDDEGSVALVTQAGVVIDSMLYNDKMHNPFVKNAEGVSLERVTFSLSPDEEANWTSASAASGFATPGYLNSTARAEAGIERGTVVVDPEIIKPQTSHQEFAQIKYHFDRSGLIANVRVFDQQGRAVKEIAGNELLGTEGFFTWHGDYSNGGLAATGYYMVWFEVFDASGVVTTFRRRVVIF